jgi:hypothetical protein
MIYSIPVRGDLPSHTVKVTLDGRKYGLAFRWSERESAWYMSISLEDATPIASGIKVVLGMYLNARLAREDAPPGLFMAYDTSGEDQEAGETDLGSRVELLYIDSTGAG